MVASVIISRTPFRISFFGGGTDYPAWYRAHNGAVLATSINKYCYLTCRRLPPFFDHKYRVVYTMMENRQSVDEIVHPAVRETLRYLKIESGLEIHHDADLPARSGLGSSSAFTVGLLHALYGLQGRMPSKQQLAMESIYIEQERIGETVGSQDQVLAAYGGFNHVQFLADGQITVRPMALATRRLDELNSFLMLFYTGIKRIASAVAQSYAGEIESKERQMRALGDMVNEGISILSTEQDLADFGHLLHRAWQTKRNLSAQVSNAYIEEIYQEAMSAGALGGKVIGAGGGGFMLFFVHPSNRPSVRRRLRKLIHVPFKFESLGSQIIFLDRQEEYPNDEQDRGDEAIASCKEAAVAGAAARDFISTR
ncbi:MAG: putative kinase related to galactokinase and mevalonate kinase [Chloroflexi bacterium]|nr:putative kinase related to galactokinase and mevalonate kinase [Chloroflexota bacterium]